MKSVLVVCPGNATRCSGHTTGHGASNSRALDFRITREVYLHSLPADARAAVQKVEDLLIRPCVLPSRISLLRSLVAPSSSSGCLKRRTLPRVLPQSSYRASWGLLPAR